MTAALAAVDDPHPRPRSTDPHRLELGERLVLVVPDRDGLNLTPPARLVPVHGIVHAVEQLPCGCTRGRLDRGASWPPGTPPVVTLDPEQTRPSRRTTGWHGHQRASLDVNAARRAADTVEALADIVAEHWNTQRGHEPADEGNALDVVMALVTAGALAQVKPPRLIPGPVAP